MKLQLAQRSTVSRRTTTTVAVANPGILHTPPALIPHYSAKDADLSQPRRQLLITAAAGVVLPPVIWGIFAPKSGAEEAPPAPPAFKKLKGYALPPDSYMGYEPNATYQARYTIEYPADWKVQKPTKTEKSTMGMDTRVHHPKSEDVEAFVVALSGPDYQGASLAKDPMDQLKAMAGSDFDLRAALTEAKSVKAVKEERQGTTFYIYDLEGEELHYLSSMAKDPKDGTLYALMARAPSGRAFSKNQDTLRRIQDSFTLLQ